VALRVAHYLADGVQVDLGLVLVAEIVNLLPRYHASIPLLCLFIPAPIVAEKLPRPHFALSFSGFHQLRYLGEERSLVQSPVAQSFGGLGF
jgi:hypothetical protein